MHPYTLMKMNGLRTLSEIRHDYILKVVRDTGGDIARASKVLRVSEAYLRKELRKIDQGAAKGSGKR